MEPNFHKPQYCHSCSGGPELPILYRTLGAGLPILTLESPFSSHPRQDVLSDSLIGLHRAPNNSVQLWRKDSMTRTPSKKKSHAALRKGGRDPRQFAVPPPPVNMQNSKGVRRGTHGTITPSGRTLSPIPEKKSMPLLIQLVGCSLPVRILLTLFKVTLEGHDFPSSFPTPELAAYAHSQKTIGMYNMATGLFSTEWTAVLETLGMDHPKNVMAQVLSMTWDHIYEALCKARNQIKHSPGSHVLADKMSDLDSRLKWCLRHQQEVLDYRHRLLVDYTDDSIKRWSRTIRRAKLDLLNNTRDYYETECLQQAKNQSALFDWLHSHKELRSRLVGEGLRDAWAKGRKLPLQNIPLDYSDDMSDEAEFDWI